MRHMDPVLQERIRAAAETAEKKTGHMVKYEEAVALPYFGQIILRFTLNTEEISSDLLDRYERILNEICGDEFLADFMGSVYRQAGADYSRLEETLRSFAVKYAEEQVIPSVHADAVSKEADRLLELSGLPAGTPVWEIQEEEDCKVLLIMGRESRRIREIETPLRILVNEVPAEQCTGLIKAAFFAKRSGISLGRLLAEMY